MKLLRYGQSGQEKPGLLDDLGVIHDLSVLIPDVSGDALYPEVLDRLSKVDLHDLPVVDSTERIGPCVGNPGKILCIGLNYSDHAQEAGMTVPEEPILFTKATSALCGPNDPLILPRGSEKTDWEVELGVVIGKPGKYIDESDAMSHVAGYCVVNDVSERAFQLERSGQWVKGKSCDTFAPVGPWLVTAEEVQDPQNLELWLDVNGQRMQSGRTNTMVFGVRQLVSYLSQFFTLHSGDIISTGTPPGVGMGKQPAVFLKAGDEIQCGISGLGMQAQTVTADDA